MFKLRKEQVAVFETLFNKRFRKSVLHHARDDLAGETQEMDDQEINSLIDDAIAASHRHNIRFERNIMLYFDLLVLLGKRFERDRKHLWITKILTDESRDENAKMDSIYIRLAALENREEFELTEIE